MVFMDPKSDIAFKKLFGNKEKPEIVISFLNSVLELKQGHLITNVTIIDPNNLPDFNTGKFSVVDISCTDQAGKLYIVEMQVIDQRDYAQRSQYYTSIAIARQLAKGDAYLKLTPVIFIGVVCFNLFASSDYLSHHLILNKETYEHALDLLAFHFIELPKFTKGLENLDGVVEKWVYLLKHADELESVPQALQKPIEVEEAMEVLKQGNWSKKELAAYDRYMDYLRTEKSRRETAEEKGRIKEKKDIACELLDIFDNERIAKITKLSIKAIEALRKERK